MDLGGQLSKQESRDSLFRSVEWCKQVMRLKDTPEFLPWFESWKARVEREVLNDAAAGGSELSRGQNKGKLGVVKKMEVEINGFATAANLKDLTTKLNKLDEQIERQRKVKNERRDSRTDFLGAGGGF